MLFSRQNLLDLRLRFDNDVARPSDNNSYFTTWPSYVIHKICFQKGSIKISIFSLLKMEKYYKNVLLLQTEFSNFKGCVSEVKWFKEEN